MTGPRLAAMSAAAGALAGVAAKLADGSGARWVNDLGNYPAIWILVVVGVGIYAASVRQAAVLGAVFFVSLCLAYYAYSRLVLGFGASSAERAWLVASVTLVPAMAAVVSLARTRPGDAASIVAGLIAAMVLSSGASRRFLIFEVPDFSGLLHPVQIVAEVVIAGAVLSIVPMSRQARRIAALCMFPALLIAPYLVQRAQNLVL